MLPVISLPPRREMSEDEFYALGREALWRRALVALRRAVRRGARAEAPEGVIGAGQRCDVGGAGNP